MSNFLEIFNKEKTVSLSDTLFCEDNLTGMSMDMYKRSYSKGSAPFYWVGSIDFSVNSMSGTKEFRVEGKNGLLELTQLMQDFIKSL